MQLQLRLCENACEKQGAIRGVGIRSHVYVLYFEVPLFASHQTS